MRGRLSAETVEFPVPRASEERVPFVFSKSENWPFRVPAVANTDLSIRQGRHLYAVAVGEAPRALNPAMA